MDYKTLKIKILLIFSIPVLAIIYFSYLSINSAYLKLKKTDIIKETSQITSLLTNMVHNIQIERGLSSGYIESNSTVDYKDKLLHQQNINDKLHDQLKTVLTHLSKEKNQAHLFVYKKSNALIKNLLDDLSKIVTIREKTLKKDISFDNIIKYYTNINNQLIFTTRVINSLSESFGLDIVALIKLETMKELAGLERAYIYNQLLGGTDSKHLLDLKNLIQKKQIAIEEFLGGASEISIDIYKRNFAQETISELIYCRDGLLKAYLTKESAQKCFEASSKYINMLDKISKLIFSNYLHTSNNIRQNAINSLYITSILWFISIISLFILMYILRQTLLKNEDMLNKLKIASYAFNSQEAMLITDHNANIIQTNSAFSKITGYSADEAKGKNPKVLSSGKHDDEFFKNMWKDLIETGKWQGEIYNKKKSGEVYPERLSITAIKGDDGKITHYIGQFLDISDIKNAQNKLQYQVDHDFLTNLLNRKSMIKRLNEENMKALRHNFKNAFFFLDLDNFKYVNDNYGHNIGDQLIVEVSQRINSLLREEDIFARISGDEFAIIILNLDSNDQTSLNSVKVISDKIIEVISKEFVIESHKINIGISIGIKLFPQDEKSIQEIISDADFAMYKAKNKGKNQYVFFDQFN